MRTASPPKTLFVLTSALCFGLLALAACISDPQPDIPQDAVVTYETVRLQVGEEQTQTTTGGLASDFATLGQPLVGDQSEVRALALNATIHANVLLYETLATVELISKFPASAKTDDSWIWANTDQGLSNRFTLGDRGEGPEGHLYTYSFQRKPSTEGEDAYATVFDGAVERVDEPWDSPRVRPGQGIIRYDFDNIKRFDARQASGTVAVAFRVRNGVRQVRVFIRNLQDNTMLNPLTAAYEYVQRPGQGGEFQFRAEADFMNDGLPFEDLDVRLEWLPNHTGRALSVVTGGSVPVEELVVHECWNSTGKTVWLQTEPEIAEVIGGAETDCDAALQNLVIDRPLIETPTDADPAIPGPYPGE